MSTIGKSRWQISLRWLLIAWAVLTVTGVLGRRVYLQYNPPPPVLLCMVDGSDQLTQMHLLSLLRRENISFSLGGSRVYACEVDAADHRRLLKLLDDAYKDSLPTVLTKDDHGTPMLVGDPRDTFEHVLQRSVAEILQHEQSESARILRAVEGHQEKEPGDDLPFVTSIAGHRRYYLQEDGKPALGYEVTIGRADRLPDPKVTSHYSYQIYDDFRAVFSLGGGLTSIPN